MDGHGSWGATHKSHKLDKHEAGWWLSFNPSEKYESIGMMTFPIHGEKCSKPPTRKGSWALFSEVNTIEGNLNS